MTFFIKSRATPIKEKINTNIEWFLKKYNNNHHNHHHAYRERSFDEETNVRVVNLDTFSTAVSFGKSSRMDPLAIQSWCIYIALAGLSTLVCSCGVVHNAIIMMIIITFGRIRRLDPLSNKSLYINIMFHYTVKTHFVSIIYVRSFRVSW